MAKDGSQGKGTMPFKWAGPNKKDTYGRQHEPMHDSYKGRVLYTPANKRAGRPEGTGKAS